MVQYITGNEVVRRERLLDQIVVRSAFQTPLLARLPHDTTTSTVTEWTADVPFASSDAVRNLSAPHADSRREGSDFSYEAANYELRLKAICEIKHHGMEMSNSDRAAVIAGMENPWDYRAGKLFTKHLNSIDNTGMYGTGSPETGGATAASGGITAGDERRMQGLIFNSAWTGQERMHATTPGTVTDPYGVDIGADYHSVFRDFNHTPLTMESFHNGLIAPAMAAGADLDGNNWMFQCGYRVMQRVSRFMIADGGVPINERQRNADDAMGNDYVNMFRLASGPVVIFRTNRWLHETDDTFSVNNDGPSATYTPGSPSSEGTQNRTYYGDKTIIGHEPGSVRWLWYREPAFQPVETDGDYGRIAVTSEVTLQVDHPLCVIGAGNVIS